MSEEATKPAPAPAPSPSPADAKAPDGAKDGDGYDPQWLQNMDSKRKADVDAWAEHYHESKVKPIESEIQGLRTQVGQLKKATELDKEALVRLSDGEAMLEDHRQAVISLYGVTEEDVKHATTVGELRMLMLGLTKGRPVAAPPGGTTDPETAEAWKSFMASRGTPTVSTPEHNDEPNRITGFGRVPSQQSDKDYMVSAADGGDWDAERSRKIAKELGI